MTPTMPAAKPPRHAGRITTWKDDQGFGFITPNGGGATVFVHIKSFADGRTRPAGSEIVTYELARNEKGQARAENVAFYRPGAARQAAPGRSPLRPLLAGGFLVFLGLLALLHRIPLAVAGYYCGISALSFLAYARDKAAARRDAWRTRESTLHLFGLIGGWPGALLAQHFIRHKSTKPSFQSSLWFTVLVNCGVLGWLVVSAGFGWLG